jgi:hypothetical protein
MQPNAITGTIQTRKKLSGNDLVIYVGLQARPGCGAAFVPGD